MQNNLWRAAALTVVLTACGGSKKEVVQQPPASRAEVRLSDQMMLSTLWVQRSAEAKYIYRQSYELAKNKLQTNLKGYKGKMSPAVILELDETVLNNTPYAARLILNGNSYDQGSWSEWVREARADAIPGALDFVRFAEANGVTVFYISNRPVEDLEPTIQNLQELNFPFADHEHVMLMAGDVSDKMKRREMVKRDHKVMLVVGDQIADFNEEFAIAGMDDMEYFTGEVPDSAQKFFVLLPNPMYGTFESSIYRENGELPDKEKVRMRREALNPKKDMDR